jgi:4-hydroxybenzoate polyprenyltransferase
MTLLKTTTVFNYLSLVKFSHTIFAMPFALIGFFLAIRTTDHVFNIRLLFLVVLCMIFARNAAMAFNRYIDKDFDKYNLRTAVREIPAGIIQPRNALLFVILNCVLFCTSTFFINNVCFLLSPLALLIVLGYSYTKRFTALCHLVLGLGLSLAPIGAYLAVTGHFSLLPLLYSFAVLTWVSGFDIIYALQDESFDRSHRLFSVPVLFGKKGALHASELLHLCAAFFVLYAGYFAQFRMWYWIGASLFVALLIYQHTLVKPNDLTRVNLAFFTTNGVASCMFALFVLLELFLS